MYVVKAPGGYLLPVGAVDREELEKWRDGDIKEGSFKKTRNSLFHRKVLALIRLGFDNWGIGLKCGQSVFKCRESVLKLLFSTKYVHFQM